MPPPDVQHELQPVKPKRGRPKGSLGTRAKLAREILEKSNFSPLEFLLRVARNRRHALEVRIDAAKSSLPFLYPRLTTVHMQAEVKNNYEITERIQAIVATDPVMLDAVERICFAMAQPDELNRLGGPCIEGHAELVKEPPQPAESPEV